MRSAQGCEKEVRIHYTDIHFRLLLLLLLLIGLRGYATGELYPAITI